MQSYATATCSVCRTASYLERRHFETPAWRCPNCGAANVNEEKPTPTDLAPLARLAPPVPTAATTNGKNGRFKKLLRIGH